MGEDYGIAMAGSRTILFRVTWPLKITIVVAVGSTTATVPFKTISSQVIAHIMAVDYTHAKEPSGIIPFGETQLLPTVAVLPTARAW